MTSLRSEFFNRGLAPLRSAHSPQGICKTMITCYSLLAVQAEEPMTANGDNTISPALPRMVGLLI